MDTQQQDLRARARAHELAGRDAAALDAYRALTATPEGAENGTAWMWMGETQLRAGEDGAADSFERAARIFAGQGLRNVALALYQRALRARPSHTDLLVRIGELSATLGYAREARLGYVEFAERKVQEGDAPAAVAALGDYLARFPEDAAVARRLAELGGEPPAPPASDEADEATAPPASPMDDLLPTRAPEATELEGIQRLEGLEPTHADEGWASEVVREVVDDSALPLLGSGEDAWRPSPPLEHGSGADDDLPLLGMEPPPPRGGEGGSSSPIGAETRPGGEPGGRLLVTHAPAPPGVDPQPAPPAPQRPPDRAEMMERILADLVAASRFVEAADTAEELVALRPGRAALQRWVELAFRAGERTRLVRAFLALARQLDADLDRRSAQELWRRVRELDPANEEAQRALAPISAPTGPPPEYVDLASLVMDDAPAAPTEARRGAEAADPFAQRTAQAASSRTGQGHLDLGLAFKEMEMLDDAISQLQNALRYGARPLATLEALGECYFAKGDHALASRVLERAANLPAPDEADRVGIYYWLARSREALGEREGARGWYRRVLDVDAGFRDAASRLAALGA